MTYRKGEQQSQKIPDEVNSLNTLPMFISHKIGYEKLTEKGGEMLERTRYAPCVHPPPSSPTRSIGFMRS
jgi:hypothetical protein